MITNNAARQDRRDNKKKNLLIGRTMIERERQDRKKRGWGQRMSGKK